MDIAVTSGVLATLRAEARRAAPQECCGLLFGNGAITRAVVAANVAADPERHFEIDPATLIAAHRAARSGGDAVVGYYHSHPAGPPDPSPTDCAAAAGDGRIWAIVGQDEVRLWRDAPAGFVALSYQVVDG